MKLNFLNRKLVVIGCLLYCVLKLPVMAFAASKNDGGKEEVMAMIDRLMPGKSKFFTLEIIPKKTLDSFHIQNQNNKILIEGTNALSMAKGVGYYLKNYCLTTVSWYLNEAIIIPKTLPIVTKPTGELCRFEHRFFMNYCTAGYTTLWWQWKDWQRLIDWMALNGINMPLAITGQEYIWQKVWKKFGMTDKEIRAFFYWFGSFTLAKNG